MSPFQLLASPWWVNLLILVPFLSYLAWRKDGLLLTHGQLAYAAIFGIAFGFVEAAVVVYLRAAGGLLPGYQGDLASFPANLDAQLRLVSQMPHSLMAVEPLREAATIFMLAAVALLVGHTRRERWAAFLWVFAFWDITYYVGLRTIIGWPESPTSSDVLFLVPVPWVAQVWYPVLVSALSLAAVLLARRSSISQAEYCPVANAAGQTTSDA
jgi:hypothetical protein